jgi:hypothetical protein
MKQATPISIRSGFGIGAGVTTMCAVSLCAVALAKPRRPRVLGPRALPLKPPSTKKVQPVKTAAKPLPRYLSSQQLNWLRHARGGGPAPRLVPTAGGAPLPSSLPTLPGVTPVGANIDLSSPNAVAQLPRLKSRSVTTRVSNQRRRPAFPRSVAPARVRRTAARPVVPRWVRYPLEFQLCGIGLGTRAVDKDRFNRIDRYGLFAMHGNPTAVVVPTVSQTAGGPGGGSSRCGRAASRCRRPSWWISRWSSGWFPRRPSRSRWRSCCSDRRTAEPYCAADTTSGRQRTIPHNAEWRLA